jgi:hypothetical protein
LGGHLRIAVMRPNTGPSIEFLEYLPPRDGRSRPADIHPNDLVHWQTMIAIDNLNLLVQRLQDAHVLSQNLSDSVPGDDAAQLVRGYSKAARDHL